MKSWSKTKKIGLVVFIVIVLLTAAGSYFFVQIHDDLEYLGIIQVPDVDLNTIEDGTYYGEYQSFPIKVEVNVTISNHRISEIIILTHQNGQGDDAETIIQDVIEEQTLNVDAIAGATYSSKVILLAIYDALNTID